MATHFQFRNAGGKIVDVETRLVDFTPLNVGSRYHRYPIVECPHCGRTAMKKSVAIHPPASPDAVTIEAFIHIADVMIERVDGVTIDKGDIWEYHDWHHTGNTN